MKRGSEHYHGMWGWLAGIATVAIIVGIMFANWNPGPPPKIKGDIAEPQLAQRESPCVLIPHVGCYGGPGK